MFVDQAKIFVKAGNGGHGSVSFRREKYEPSGGPNGGDGGRGGNVIIEVDTGLKTLMDYRYKKHYKADSGEDGSSYKKHGKDGKDLVLKVPPGTVIKDEETGNIIADMLHSGQQIVIAKGGRGGRGNAHFATSTRQAPEFAESGRLGEELWIVLELKLLADVGLIGFPNVGKSTILSVVSAARPKIGNYHFTTLIPNLGVVELEEGKSFILADIPGLIEGAHEGAGLGHDFLRHIERTKVLIHVLDIAGSEGRDPLEDFRQVNGELGKYSGGLSDKPQIVAANKMDLPRAARNFERVKGALEAEGYEVFDISAASNRGLKKLMYRAFEIISRMEEQAEEDIEQTADMRYYKFNKKESYSVRKEGNIFIVDGEWIERFMDRINIYNDESLKYFHRVMREKGIIDELKKMGVNDGDTVKVSHLEFEYYE